MKVKFSKIKEMKRKLRLFETRKTVEKLQPLHQKEEYI